MHKIISPFYLIIAENKEKEHLLDIKNNALGVL